MRLLELDPQFAQEFPKYKHVKKGGFSVFKGKAGKGMPEEVGVSVRGEPPQGRAGHSASALGRHVLLFFGGRTVGGMSDELFALVQHRAELTVSVRSAALSWSKPSTERNSPAPCARAYHAVAEMERSLLLFGGEVRVRQS